MFRKHWTSRRRRTKSRRSKRIRPNDRRGNECRASPPHRCKDLAPAERHPRIFGTLHTLTPGGMLHITSDHEPRPLQYQLETGLPGKFPGSISNRAPRSGRSRSSDWTPGATAAAAAIKEKVDDANRNEPVAVDNVLLRSRARLSADRGRPVGSRGMGTDNGFRRAKRLDCCPLDDDRLAWLADVWRAAPVHTRLDRAHTPERHVRASGTSRYGWRLRLQGQIANSRDWYGAMALLSDRKLAPRPHPTLIFQIVRMANAACREDQLQKLPLDYDVSLEPIGRNNLPGHSSRDLRVLRSQYDHQDSPCNGIYVADLSPPSPARAGQGTALIGEWAEHILCAHDHAMLI